MLREDQIRRYARHIVLPDLGGVGQERLLAARVRIDPRDPAARVAFDYLVAAGVGTIALADGAPDLPLRAKALNPDVTVIVEPGPAPAIAPIDPDPLIRGGAFACALIHQLATGS